MKCIFQSILSQFFFPWIGMDESVFYHFIPAAGCVERALDQCRSNRWETRLVIFKRGRVGQVRKSECWLMPLGIIFGTYEFSYRKESQRQWRVNTVKFDYEWRPIKYKRGWPKREKMEPKTFDSYTTGRHQASEMQLGFFCINSVFTRLGWHKRKPPFPVVESPPLYRT